MASVKGIDKMIMLLSKDDCPSDWGLKNINYIKTEQGCKYGNGGEICKECWKLALDTEIDKGEIKSVK